MGPDDGLNELLPVAPAREEKHQAEGPNKVSTKEEQPVASTGRSVRLNDLDLQFPASMEDDHRDAVIHPEQA